MKPTLILLSVLLAVTGLAPLTVLIAMSYSLPEPGFMAIVEACFACLCSICCIAPAVQHIRKHDRDTALVVANITGVLAWLLINRQAVDLVRNTNSEIWKVASVVIPVISCYYVTKRLREAIERKYESEAEQGMA